MKTLLRPILSALILLLFSSPGASAAQWDLEAWLDEPGTKLVAVEFYADWCEPCKASAPRWEALRKKYARQGLKLVVVNLTEESLSSGKCSRLPWNPDTSLCDPKIGEALGVKSLPEAFVWSWQGNLLVDRDQHVDKIERIIRRYLDDNPRVQVSATTQSGKRDRALQRKVEAALGRSGKLTVVPDKEMRKRLAKVREESHGSGRRDDQRCALGAEVSANSLLSVERYEGALALTLADAESGCQRATASVPLSGEPEEQLIQKVVYRLMAQLKRRSVQMPEGAKVQRRPSGKRKVGVEDISEEADDWVADEEIANVQFTSDPPGAKVTLGGKMLCERTPCSRDLDPGRHRVVMTLDRYAPETRTINLADGDMVGWRLKPTFATLNITSSPPGVEVRLDDKALGETPIEGLEVDEGEHTVTIGDKCYYPKTQKLSLPRGKTHTVEVTLKSRPAGLRVQASDDKGDSIKGATILVDGEVKGKTPKTVTLNVCAQKLSVTHPDYATFDKTLRLRERKTLRVRAKLGSNLEEIAREREARERAEAEAEFERQKAEREAARAARRAAQEAQARRRAEAEAEAEAAREEEEETSYYDSGWMSEELRLEFLFGLLMCMSDECSDDMIGPTIQGGLFYDFNRYMGLGITGAFNTWDRSEGEDINVHAAVMFHTHLPVDFFEFSAGVGIGLHVYEPSSWYDDDDYSADQLVMSIPLSTRLGFFLTEDLIFGVDATFYVDFLEPLERISLQFGALLEYRVM